MKVFMIFFRLLSNFSPQFLLAPLYFLKQCQFCLWYIHIYLFMLANHLTVTPLKLLYLDYELLKLSPVSLPYTACLNSLTESDASILAPGTQSFSSDEGLPLMTALPVFSCIHSFSIFSTQKEVNFKPASSHLPSLDYRRSLCWEIYLYIALHLWWFLLFCMFGFILFIYNVWS